MNAPGQPPRSEHERRIEKMIDEQLRPRGIVMRNVLNALRVIPRHLFVPHEYADHAYDDNALPTRHGQTISQPFIVALMTQELRLCPGMRVLELGTGTGYQTAILAHIVGPTGEVCTIETVPDLADSARRRLDALGISNVRYLTADGSLGWPASAAEDWPTFDRILVAAATAEIPAPLLAQLRDPGILVIPLGSPDTQALTRIEKQNGHLARTALLDCRFVPLVGRHAWDIADYQQQRGGG